MGEDSKRAAHRALAERVVRGDGRASAGDRAAAFANRGLGGAVGGLVGKVASRAADVTDEDFAAAKAAGLSEDELFEIVVCAAVGAATRRYEAGLAALAEAQGVDRAS